MNFIVAPKDKDTIIQKSGVVYKCVSVECYEEYTGECTIPFRERLEEHLKSPFPIYEHSTITSVDNFSIVARESQNLTTVIKAILKRMNDPSLYRNIGKYQYHMFWIRLCSPPQNSSLSRANTSQHLPFPCTCCLPVGSHGPRAGPGWIWHSRSPIVGHLINMDGHSWMWKGGGDGIIHIQISVWKTPLNCYISIGFCSLRGTMDPCAGPAWIWHGITPVAGVHSIITMGR